jgi:L-aspartate oxidase
VPVAPGAHYACGGVAADLCGRTSVRGLYAVGEVASTGLHGANRLASNSLTEALASGRRCGQVLARGLPDRGRAVAARGSGRVDDGVDAAQRRRLAEAVGRDLGVVRTADGIQEVLDTADCCAPARANSEDQQPISLDDIEALSLHTVSTAVAAAALAREESRGCHRRDDFPTTSADWQRRLSVGVDGDVVEVRIGERVP